MIQRLHPRHALIGAASLLGLGALGLTTLEGCTEVECATPDYTRAECRVLAENEVARLRSSEGVEVRFQTDAAAEAQDHSSWAAEGVVRELGEVVEARGAHMGAYALSLRPDASSEAQEVQLRLTNVHPRALVRTLAPGGVELVAEGQGTTRSITAPVSPGQTTWVRVELDCSGYANGYRIAALGDVQTNPTQFARILERMQDEAVYAEQAGQLFVGAVMAGDLTETATEEEFIAFAEALEPASFPIALVPGNHDIYDGYQPHYNLAFGPGNYAFDVCDSHLAMLDTGSGSLAPSIIGRLPQLFAKGEQAHSLTVMHHPPYAELSAAGWSDEAMAMIMLGEFAHQDGDAVIAGHAHMLDEFDLNVAGRDIEEIIAGTAGAAQGAGHPLYGYVRLTFTGDGDTIERCFVEVPTPGAIPVQNTTSDMPICDEA